MNYEKVRGIADEADNGLGAYIDANEFAQADSARIERPPMVHLDGWFTLQQLRDLVSALES